METETMIRQLRRLEKEHENDVVYTFQTRWSDVCHDVANRLEELNQQVEHLKQCLSVGTLAHNCNNCTFFSHGDDYCTLRKVGCRYGETCDKFEVYDPNDK